MDRTTESRTARYAYGEVAARLREAITAQHYAAGQRLPPEVELAGALGVSRGTLRQALQVLLRDGLIETVPGRGTFVTAPARSISAGLIGMVLPSVVRARNPELIAGAEAVLRKAGYSLVLGISGDDRAMEAEQLQRMVEQGAAGVIVYTVDGPLDAPALRALAHRAFPLVLIDRYLPDLAVDAVCMDNLGGAFQAVQHLAELGYRRIGYIGTDNLGTSSIVERMAGYQWAIRQYGLPWTADLMCAAVRRLHAWPPPPDEAELREHNERVLREYLARPDRPQAVFICNDYVAFQVVNVAEQIGLRVPDDLAVVGFDNVAYTDYFGVPLSTIEQDRHEVGSTAARLLLQRIGGSRTRVERIVISTRLIVRASSNTTGRESHATPAHSISGTRNSGGRSGVDGMQSAGSAGAAVGAAGHGGATTGERRR